MKNNCDKTKTDPLISLIDNDLVSRLMARANLEKSRFRIAEAEYGVETLSKFDQLNFATEVKKALENEEFSLWYQPKVDLRDGHVVGAESLVRWTHPTLGIVPASKIISAIEDLGLIVPFTEWALQDIKNMQRAWQIKKLPPLRTAINISSKQLVKQQLPTIISQNHENTGLDLALLEIELPERTLTQQGDNALGSLKQLKKLKKLGVSISIDDFGTEYPSLAYLKTYPIDTIKIDRFFIKDIQENSPKLSIIKAISTLASNLEMNVVAEGIETLDQYRILRDLGCNIGQGFLFCQALPIEDLELLIQTNQSFIPYLELPMGTVN